MFEIQSSNKFRAYDAKHLKLEDLNYIGIIQDIIYSIF